MRYREAVAMDARKGPAPEALRLEREAYAAHPMAGEALVQLTDAYQHKRHMRLGLRRLYVECRDCFQRKVQRMERAKHQNVRDVARQERALLERGEWE